MLFHTNQVCRTKFLAAFSLAAILMFSAVPGAKAQEVAVAEVDGHVTDPSGASIAGATVKMTEADKQIVHRAEAPALPASLSFPKETVETFLFDNRLNRL
jgi:hypothetical protein